MTQLGSDLPQENFPGLLPPLPFRPAHSDHHTISSGLLEAKSIAGVCLENFGAKPHLRKILVHMWSWVDPVLDVLKYHSLVLPWPRIGPKNKTVQPAVGKALGGKELNSAPPTNSQPQLTSHLAEPPRTQLL